MICINDLNMNVGGMISTFAHDMKIGGGVENEEDY